jgi:hypothetical protein
MNDTNGTMKKGFFYYCGGNASAPGDDLRYAFSNPAKFAKALLISGGPDGGGGAIFSDPATPQPADYTTIKWTKIPGSPHYLGVDPAVGLPGPDDLIRDEIIDGYGVTLGGDVKNEWIVPLARIWPEGTKIPATMGYGPDGDFVTEPVERYRPLCKKAERIFDAVAAGAGLIESPDGGDLMTIGDGKEGFDLAVEILAVNYRIGAAEASALKLIDTDNLHLIIGCLVDLPRISEEAEKRVEKKTDTDEGDGVNTPDGGPD